MMMDELEVELEAENLNPQAKKQLKTTSEAFQTLADQIERKDISDFAIIEESFTTAEMRMAESYLHLTKVYIVSKPESARSYLEAAIEKMNSANKRVKKAAQLNIKKISENSQLLLEKTGIKVVEFSKAINNQMKKMDAWMKEHSTKISRDKTTVELI
ncbi:MAG: hypothetical protein ACI9XO_004889 [Paraglaciecola sp.]|jgi:hypothetical protein